MAYKEYRRLTVIEQSGYQYMPTPAIRLQGAGLLNSVLKQGTRLWSSVKAAD